MDENCSGIVVGAAAGGVGVITGEKLLNMSLFPDVCRVALPRETFVLS